MPQNYVGNNVFTSPLVLPLNGELAEANISADGCWKALADRTIFNEDQRTLALLNRRPAVCDVQIFNNQIRITRLSEAYARDVTTGTIVALTPTLPFSVPVPGGLVEGIVYYFYLFVNNGVYGIEVSDVVPSSTNVFKTGTENKKYIGSSVFRSGSLKGETISNQFTVCEPYIVGLPINAGMPSTTPLLYVPATVTSIFAKIVINNSGAMMSPTAFWRPTGSTSSFSQLVAPGMGATEIDVDFPCSVNQEVDLWTSSPLVFITVYCQGWVE